MLIEAIDSIVDPAVSKALQGSSYKTAVEQLAHDTVLETHVLDAVATRMIESSAFTAPAELFAKNEVEYYSFKQIKMENRYKGVAKVFEKTRPSSSGHGSRRSARPPADITDEYMTNSLACLNYSSREG